MAKIDRRIQRTDQLLRDSLIALILEKGYDAITISDITENANLGRATFYLHYRDKDELLVTCLEGILDRLSARIAPHLEGLIQGETEPIRVTFQYVEENKNLYLILLRAQGAVSIARDLRTYIARDLQGHIERALQGRVAPVPLSLATTYVASSLIGLIGWWLENNMPYSAEEMAQLFYRLNVRVVLQELGLSEY